MWTCKKPLSWLYNYLFEAKNIGNFKQTLYSIVYNRFFKAKNPNFNYKYLYIECYYFRQQYKNHFKTVRATKPKYIFFTTLFFYNKINFNQNSIKYKKSKTRPPFLSKTNLRLFSNKILENLLHL